MLIPAGYEPHLAAVTAAPFDDLPRLAMADWLDEHGGGEWAAYIREQVAAYDWGRPEWYQAEMVMTAGPDRPALRLANSLGCCMTRGWTFFVRGFPCAFGTAGDIPEWAAWFPTTYCNLGEHGRVMIAIRPCGEVWVQSRGRVTKVWRTRRPNIVAFLNLRQCRRIKGVTDDVLDSVWMCGEQHVFDALMKTNGYRPLSETIMASRRNAEQHLL